MFLLFKIFNSNEICTYNFYFIYNYIYVDIDYFIDKIFKFNIFNYS